MSKKEIQMEKSPKLTVEQIIEYCKNELGITFNLMTEEDARMFLQKNNFFFRLKQYAQTNTEKTKSGKYKGLDFGHLVELSTIDMFLRKILLKMSIDLEHYLKVKLVNDCQSNPADDGYEVVDEFLKKNERIRESLVTFTYLYSYSGNKFDKYVKNPSVWSFIDMINFGELINFYTFYYEYFRTECTYTKYFESVRRIRNACAHNICMISSFKPVNGFKYDVSISFELLQGNIGIGNGVIASCLKVPLLNDFAVMLSVYTKLISSAKIKEKTLEEIKEFFDGRMIYRKQYFEGNSDIKNAYSFARKVLEYYSAK